MSSFLLPLLFSLQAATIGPLSSATESPLLTMSILLAVILWRALAISHAAFHRGSFLFLQPLGEPIFPPPSQLFILFIFVTCVTWLLKLPFGWGEFVCFGGEVGKINFPQTFNPSASAFQLLELQTGTDMPLLSYCSDAGELSVIFQWISWISRLNFIKAQKLMGKRERTGTK